jgi:hypothetical protein
MPAKTDRIQDEGLRNSLVEAQVALKSGDYRRVVDLSTTAYVEMLRRKPELTQGAAQMQSIMFFPRLGAHIQLNSESKPEIIYDREKFIFSEAITYYEFVVDYLIRVGI